MELSRVAASEASANELNARVGELGVGAEVGELGVGAEADASASAFSCGSTACAARQEDSTTQV